MAAGIAWEHLLLLEESLVVETSRTLLVPRLQRKAGVKAVDHRAIPGAAVVMAAVQEDTMLRLAQELCLHEAGQIHTERILRGGITAAHHVVCLPRVIFAL